MENMYIKAVAQSSPKAVNEMLVTLAAAVLSSNHTVGSTVQETAEKAASIATETLDNLLAVTLEKDDSDSG